MTASKLPGIHYTRSQTFDLPVEMEGTYRATLTEIRLYVKTPTSGWSLLDKGTAELKRFNIRVTQDGEYWYSLATVSIGLRVLTVNDLPTGHRGGELYLAHLVQKERLAATSAPSGLSALGLTAL